MNQLGGRLRGDREMTMTTTSTNGQATRVERDTMGEMQVPVNAYYGASTQRAVQSLRQLMG